MTQPLEHARRLVVKIGSSLLIEEGTGRPRASWMQSVAEDVAALAAEGKELVIVSSGAVALGRGALGLQGKSLSLEEKQAAAACGQIALMQAWREAFAPHGIEVAQVLLTLEDSEARRRYLNARATLSTLLAHRVIPIINENDTVATAEIRIGDNDRLAARVAQMVSADLLVLLSDIDGLYTTHPKRDAGATLVERVERITPEIEAMAGSAGAFGSGGMVTKLAAAKIATGAGCAMVICSGRSAHPLKALQDSGRGTWFAAAQSPLSARKHWIAGSVEPKGAVVIDAGAASALASGKSLLPAGVKDIKGTFGKGDTVFIQDTDGRTLGKGLIAVDAEDARKILGLKTSELESALGYHPQPELIHRDDMVWG